MTRVLVDTSIWVRHFRRADTHLQALLASDRVLCHPLVLLEVACGTPPAPRARTLEDLANLDRTPEATPEEILGLIEREQLHDSGCGAVDMSLLASALLANGARLWTDDRALRAQAERLGIGYAVPAH
jgi:predicted nucleic acid-binding protein